MKLVLIAFISYLMGCFSAAYFVSKKISQVDIRDHGSGNSGTTNVLRVVGKKAAIITLICDLFKGVIATLIGRYLGGDLGIAIAGIFVVIGHNWPVFLNFKGGKGIATSIGIMLVVDYKLAVIALLIWLFIVIITNYVSLASLSLLFSYTILFIIKYRSQLSDKYMYVFLFIALFISSVVRHKENIKRLLSGTENKLRR